MKKFKLVYIDDHIDYSLTGYLRDSFENTEIEYNEREFIETESYDSLLEDKLVKYSDVILIDSKLFENRNVGNRKFTGEEFKILITKIYPFKKVFIISQNEDEKKVGFIKKADLDDEDKVKEYYDRELKTKIEDAIRTIKVEIEIFEDMCGKKYIDPVILEQIKNSLQGEVEFDPLTRQDIDKVIDLFNQLKL